MPARRLLAASCEGTDGFGDEEEDEEGEQSMSRRVLAVLPGPTIEAPRGGSRGVKSLGGRRRPWPKEEKEDDDDDDDDVDDEEDAGAC